MHSTVASLATSLRLDLLVKLVTAVILGGAIGLERELSGKPAGLRTNILICLGSAILMDLSIRVGITDNGVRAGDPGRIAAQVVSGVGFLCAGTILQARGVVVGLTTAATIWVVAAIGLTVGAGNFVEAVGATVIVGGVLAGLGRMERWLHSVGRTVRATVRMQRGASADDLLDLFHSFGVVVKSKKLFEHSDDWTYELVLRGAAKQFDHLAGELTRRGDVMSVQFE